MDPHPYRAADDRYEVQPQRRCGRSGLVLPAVSLGLWQEFGAEVPWEDARARVLRAFDLGVFHIDLANNYGPPPGSAEETFGRIVARDLAPYRDELIVSTKAGFQMWPGPFGEWGSRKSLLASLDQSLKRMKLDYVDIFYSHRFDPNTPLEETMGALADAVQSGRALYVGVSNYDAEQTVRAHDLLTQMGVPLTIHQPRYSIFDRAIEPDLLQVLRERGIGAIAYSPLAQGLLTDRYLAGVPADSRAARGGSLPASRLDADVVRRVRELAEIARGRGTTLARMALAWCLRDEVVTSVAIGASRLAQLEENVAAADFDPFGSEELVQIDAWAARPGHDVWHPPA